MSAPLGLEALERRITERRKSAIQRWGATPPMMPGDEDAEALLEEVRRLRAVETAALAVTTDAAQELLEDPVGSSDRLPFVRVHKAALDALSAVLREVQP